MSNIDQISKIARLFIDKSSESSFETSFDNVVNWVGEAKKVDTTGHEPIFNVNITDFRQYRSDTNPTPSDRSDILSNNNGGKDGFFATKLVVE